jgi:hypothetical protein
MRYLSEAFWAKVEVPYLGAIPFNTLRESKEGTSSSSSGEKNPS